jgi:drug/metabolite transporter (DMT)-like permease
VTARPIVADVSPSGAKPEAPAWQVWTALGIVYVVWGSTYLAISIAVDSLPPMLTGGVRFLTAGVVMLAVVTARSSLSLLRSVDRRQLASCALVGCALATGGNGLVMVAEQHIASGLAALVIAAVPMWVVLMRRLTGDPIPRITLLGVTTGFAGVALLLLPGGGGHVEIVGFLTVLGASLSWATGSFLSPRLPMPPDPLLSTGLQMTAGGVLGILIGAATGEFGRVHADRIQLDSVLAFVYLIVFGSLIAYTAYSWVLQNAPISKVATYAYVNPVIAIFLGWLVRDESITLTIAIGAAVIVCSVAAVVRTERSKR